MVNQDRFHVRLPRPDGSADLLHIVKEAESMLQKAVDSMGPGDSEDKPSIHLTGPGHDSGASAGRVERVDVIGPGHDSGDSAGRDGWLDSASPGGEDIGRGAIARGYGGHRKKVVHWREDIESGDRIAGSVVDDASMIGPRALGTLRHTVTSLQDQLSVPGKLTKNQEMIMRGHIDSALGNAQHVVLLARQDSEDNALRIDQNLPKRVERYETQDGRVTQKVSDGPPPDGAELVRVKGDSAVIGDKAGRKQHVLTTTDDPAVRNVKLSSRMTTDAPSPSVGMPMQSPLPGSQDSGESEGGLGAMSAWMPLMQAISSLTQKSEEGD
ncbi:hypothetical protein [Nocardia testacea]|uniref:hypothetical protein n=1 Tax=Nocardia testacea TaxID=248551 RepID=UPI003A8A03B3